VQSEFSIQGTYPYNRSSATRWVISHIFRHRLIAVSAILAILTQNALNSLVQRLIGVAFDDHGLMQLRFASINDKPIPAAERLMHWPLGRRPDDHPGLSALGL